MNQRGFTLVELLVASVISLFIAGAALMLASGARTVFTVEPAALDAVQRLRAGVDVITASIASAGGERGIGDDAGGIASGLPALRLTRTGGSEPFTGIAVIRAVQGGRARLSQDQPGPAGSLTLDPQPGLCPRTAVVCGFDEQDVAVVFDQRGHFDVFVVAAVSDALGRITPRGALGYAYRSGAWVVAARYERLVLVRQADGSHTLTRLTAAGAREPILDGVTRLEAQAWGEARSPVLQDISTEQSVATYGLTPPLLEVADAEGIFANGSHCMAARDAGVLTSTLAARAEEAHGLARLAPADLEDGPWCPHDDAADRFDADWFRVRRVDVLLQVEAGAEFRGTAGPLFTRAGTGAHDAPRWIRDRQLQFSMAVRR